MKQFPRSAQGSRSAQASRKSFYFFIGLVSLVQVMDLAGGVSSVDSEARKKELREWEKALFVDRVVNTAHPVATPPPQDSIAPPVSPLTNCTAGSSTSATCLNNSSITALNQSKGSVYPSTITVTGLSGAVTNVTLVLHGVNSTTDLAGVQLLLLAPGGTKLVFLAGDGLGDGGTHLTNADITINDASPPAPSCGNGNFAIPARTYRRPTLG